MWFPGPGTPGLLVMNGADSPDCHGWLRRPVISHLWLQQKLCIFVTVCRPRIKTAFLRQNSHHRAGGSLIRDLASVIPNYWTILKVIKQDGNELFDLERAGLPSANLLKTDWTTG